MTTRMTERRWPKGLRVRPVGQKFFVGHEDEDAVFREMTGTVVAPTYSLSSGERYDWWVDDDRADSWVIVKCWEVEPIPPIWVRQGRPKPDRLNDGSSLKYGRDHSRIVVWRDEEDTIYDGEGRWAVDYEGEIERYFETWHEAIEYANELAYNRG